MAVEHTALAISIFSVLVASLSLGWNIYRDVILKPKVKVQIGVVTVLHPTLPGRPRYLNITATNFGPGPVTLSTICVREAQMWRRILRKTKHAMITHDYTNTMSAKLPSKIEVGDKISLLLPYDEECFLTECFTDIGVSDYYARIHWAPRSELVKAYETWEKDFGASANRAVSNAKT